MPGRLFRPETPELTVIWFQGGWSILDGKRRLGAFEYQVDAVDAAFRLRDRVEGSRPRVLVQTRNGELRPA